MHRIIRWLSIALVVEATSAAAVPASPPDTSYVAGEASQDGTGKFYMGREIARVMGHRGADWLERPDREREEATSLVVREMELLPTDEVADIGAGTGYFTFRLSPAVPEGAVYAVDIQQEMLDIIEARAARDSVRNVVPVLGEIDDPRLPANGIDVVLMVDAYHEFSHPREMMRGVVRALRPGGRVILIEYRLEDPDVPIKRLHKMSQEQVRREMESVRLEWVETRDMLPRQHFMVFRKPAGTR